MPRVAPDPKSYVPLKPLVFQVLLALTDGERHGWALAACLVPARRAMKVDPVQALREGSRKKEEG